MKDEETGARICRTPGDAGCTFVFKYQYHREGTGGDIKIFKIQAEKDRTCPEPINVIGIILPAVYYYRNFSTSADIMCISLQSLSKRDYTFCLPKFTKVSRFSISYTISISFRRLFEIL